MLKPNVLEKLNEQINAELYSAYLYYSMAGYFESINLKGFANWMTIQAQEELTHVARFFNYVNDRSARVSMRPVGGPPNDWASPKAALEDVYNHECSISEKINECVTLALKENDHPTNSFLQWFVAEQVEEEATADAIVQSLKLIGDNTSGLFLLDVELSKRVFTPAPTAG